MVVTSLRNHYIKGRLLRGDFNGQLRTIPRIKLSSGEKDLTFTLTCKQFPVRLCFAMTINKSQGQSAENATNLKNHLLSCKPYLDKIKEARRDNHVTAKARNPSKKQKTLLRGYKMTEERHNKLDYMLAMSLYIGGLAFRTF